MVKVSATMVEFCPGISTATTLSSVPEACGLARFRNDTKATTIPSTMMAMTRIFPEGRFFLAVPNSSPMLMVGPEGAAGGFGGEGGGGPNPSPMWRGGREGAAGGFGVEGVEGGFDMGLSYARFYAGGERVARV